MRSLKFKKNIIPYIGNLFLLSLLLGLFVSNNVIVENAYKHINQHRNDQLLFTEFQGNYLYKAVHFLLPVNPINVALWGDAVKDDGKIFSWLILSYIIGTIAVLKFKHKYILQGTVYIFFSLLSLMLFNSSDSFFLFILNCAVYAISLFLVYHGLSKRKLYLTLIGTLSWLIPNFYQILFLEGLYI